MRADKLIKRAGVDKPYTTLKNYDPVDKTRAYELFMTTDRDLTDIAIELGVNREVISAWSREGEWLARRKTFEAELMRAADEKYKAFVMENKLPVLRRHIRISGKMENAIEQIIDEEIASAEKDGKPMDDKLIRRMADALAAVTGVSAKAIGLADTIVQNNGPGGGRVPLVAIGISPQLPSERTGNGPTIEVREIEQ